jgi:hypothetical protein
MNHKEQLIRDIETKFKTTMIGAIAQFEKQFGYLWEQDSVNREKYEDLWEEARYNILNNGNHQIRSALKTLSEFLYYKPVTFKEKYHYKFYFGEEKNNQNNRNNK